jgi:hypothetical protein
MRRSQAGQATVEWSALLLVTAMVLAGLGYAVAHTQAWGMGEGLLHSIVCAVGGCDDGADALERAYGEETAALVRRYTPNVAYERRSAALPIDFRRCREQDCANGPHDPVEIERSSAGLPVTAFTRVIDRRPAGGALYIQYWFYFPESFSGGIGRVFGHRWPGYHADDWEGVQLMVISEGVMARATAHGGYSSEWVPWRGWYRVSGGSHAGQVVEHGDGERTTRSSGIKLTPLERLRGLNSMRFTIVPPWLKAVYRDPESASS